MIVSDRMIKQIFTIFFLLFVSLVAFHIPNYALLNDPIFRSDRSKIFNFSQQQNKIFRSEGMILSNINSIDTLVPFTQDQASSLYDLYISFDTNFFNNYQVININYETNYSESVRGSFSGRFISEQNTILLLPSQNSIFSKHNRLQSFTLSFDLFPYVLNEGTQTIAEYIIYSPSSQGSVPYGFRVSIIQGFVVYEFLNFFTDANLNTYSFTLQERSQLRHDTWEQHTLVVDSQSKTVRIYRNGNEQAVEITTDDQLITGRKLSASSLFSVPNLTTPLIIANNAMFSLDNFAVYQGAVTQVFENTAQKKSFMETEVFKISDNHSFLNFMNFQNILQTNQSIRLAYRFQEDYFSPDQNSNQLPWVYIDPQAKAFPSSQSEGRFLQWRMEHYPSYTNIYDNFAITNILASYYETTPPIGIIIESVQSHDQAIEIKWKNPQDPRIIEYEIYYGVKPKTYFGTSEVSPNSPINITKLSFRENNTASYRIEGLENETTYFISIRAKDIYGQYSIYSPEVQSLPSSINNGFGFSVGR